MLPAPKNTKEYPFYILCYWIILWGILFLYTSFVTFSSVTSDGKYVEKTDCIDKSSNSTCNKHSDPYYVPVGTELIYTFIPQGIGVGVFVIVGGSLLMYKNSKKRRN